MSLTEKEMKLKSDVENSKISGIDAIAAVSNFVSHYLKSLGFNQMVMQSIQFNHCFDSQFDLYFCRIQKYRAIKTMKLIQFLTN